MYLSSFMMFVWVLYLSVTRLYYQIDKYHQAAAMQDRGWHAPAKDNNNLNDGVVTIIKEE